MPDPMTIKSASPDTFHASTGLRYGNMRGLLVLTFALGAQCLAQILTNNVTDAVNSRYLVVLKKGVTESVFASHMERANLASSLQGAKTFNINGLMGYSVIATSEGIKTLAESGEVC